jgi:ribosomal protein S18 acetylase RimI-like enzyme
MLEIIHAETEEQLDIVRMLFEEYQGTRPGDPALEDFPAEISSLPGRYGPPDGALLLAFYDGEPAGCVALRAVDQQTAEMKRLYVRPQCRGLRVGKTLAEARIEEARKSGFERMRLDTIPGMDEAQSLYRRLGFKEIPAYRFNPNPQTLFFELSLIES